jgi:methionyl-tRNA formyltransferase
MTQKENKKCRLVFFSSGDFPYYTIEQLLKFELYDIVGIVTSEYKSETIGKTIAELANEYDIPCIKIHKNEELKSDDVLTWLRDKEADVFCVISFKFLPNEVLSIPKIASFNIHASLLPFLRGAAPIYWAIRHNFKYTGLTSFILDEHIDTGDIITNIRIPIVENETYGTLYNKLSIACIGFTVDTISRIYRHDDWKRYLLLQPDCGINSPYSKAPKLDASSTRLNLDSLEHNIKEDRAKETYSLLRALSPNIGCNASLIVYQKVQDESDVEIKRFDIKIYDSEYLSDANINTQDVVKYRNNQYSNTVTDGKNYMYIMSSDLKHGIAIKELQIAGKKKMSIKDFLMGFQYSRMKDKYIKIV